ncbi:MAG TPA: hypothetical protein VG737_09045 [Cyclobacteriaceae bacterium]|nr:hypothetical protein [Cyclobacteriaceae bacterium]
MALHCSSRLGLLDYLYEQRHEIANKLGIIAEVPIALCSSEYDFDPGLVVLSTDDSDQGLPSPIAHAQEIQLFYSRAQILLEDLSPSLSSKQLTAFAHQTYASPALSIFHPPS